MDDFIGLLDFIAEEEQDEKLWQRWTAMYQGRMSYADFKAKLQNDKYGEAPIDETETLLKVKQILDSVRKDDA